MEAVWSAKYKLKIYGSTSLVQELFYSILTVELVNECSLIKEISKENFWCLKYLWESFMSIVKVQTSVQQEVTEELELKDRTISERKL